MVIAGNLLLLIARLLDILVLIVIADAILSWVPGLNPASPVVRVIRGIAEPVVAPFRGRLGPVGALDLTPILAVVALIAISALIGSLAASVGLGASAAYTVFSALQQLLLVLLAIIVVLVVTRLLLALFQVDSWHPMSRAIHQLSRPFCQPFEGVVVSQSAVLDVAALLALLSYIVLYIAIDVIFGSLILPIAG